MLQFVLQSQFSLVRFYEIFSFIHLLLSFIHYSWRKNFQISFFWNTNTHTFRFHQHFSFFFEMKISTCLVRRSKVWREFIFLLRIYEHVVFISSLFPTTRKYICIFISTKSLREENIKKISINVRKVSEWKDAFYKS